MRRSLSPILRRELQNLDKDADSRKSAMKALKSYVKELDSKAIPLFLAQVSETKETGSSGEYTISLYEVLARVHGTKIASQIDNIMSTIIKSLSSSAGSFALHQACSKVVPAIARYGMEPTTPEDKKRHVIHSLCKPLSDCLLGSQESLSSGAALCLKALVDCDNWRYASNEMVNEVCQRVSGALEKHTQTNSHMALVMALAKHNSSIVEAYARLLIHIGLQILNADIGEGNAQRRLISIHMMNTMMKCLDPKSIFSEVNIIIEEMEKFQSDQVGYISGAAFEALQNAKRISIDKSSKFDRDTSSNGRRRIMCGSRDVSPFRGSPESQIVDSFLGSDSLVDSPTSINQSCQVWGYDRKSANRKLWSNRENGFVNVSLKDGIVSEAIRANALEDKKNDEFFAKHGEYTNGFSGFFQGNGFTRSNTPSPQRSRSYINVDNVKIYTTPRKLIRSLQEVNDDYTEKQSREYKSPSTRKLEWSPKSNGHCNNNGGESFSSDEQYHDRTESVCSTEDVLTVTDQGGQVLEEMVTKSVIEPQSVVSVRNGRKWRIEKKFLAYGVVMVLLAVFLFFFFVKKEEVGYNRIPT